MRIETITFKAVGSRKKPKRKSVASPLQNMKAWSLLLFMALVFTNNVKVDKPTGVLALAPEFVNTRNARMVLNGVATSYSCGHIAGFYRTRRQQRRKKSSSMLSMGMKINIRIVGRKSSEPWLEEGCEMYNTRLRPSNVEVETTWHKENSGLMKGVNGDKFKGHTVVLLDPTGSTKTSERFAEDMYEWLDRGGSRLSFVVGGAEGLPVELKYPPEGPKPTMISLSALTFTHQFARMLLIEQIYRATEIRRGSGYHK